RSTRVPSGWRVSRMPGSLWKSSLGILPRRSTPASSFGRSSCRCSSRRRRRASGSTGTRTHSQGPTSSSSCGSTETATPTRRSRPGQAYAAMHPAGEPSRLDEFRARLARDLCERLTLAEEDPELGEAIDRWELSLFQDGAERDDSRRQSLATLLAGEDGPFA